jgi:hypothetical protein
VITWPSNRLFWKRSWIFGFYKMLGISWLSTISSLDFQKELLATELSFAYWTKILIEIYVIG